jgi:ribonuclease HI
MSPVAQQPTLDAFFEQTPPPAAIVYTDGGCDPNPGPGGWAAVLQIQAPERPPAEVVLTGNHPQTTNNRMELEAAIAALAYLRGRYGHCRVELHTDSTYLRSGISRWIARWAANGWQTRARQAVKNRDLWHRLYGLVEASGAEPSEGALSVEWHWVKGHAGDPLNERVDYLATEARARLGANGDARPEPAPAPTTAGDMGPQIQLSVAASSRGAHGPGGWAAVLSSDTAHTVLDGREPEATNLKLALLAANAGLRALGDPARVTVYTTEETLSKGASEWVHTWRGRGWTTSSNKPVQHRELWQALLQAAEPHHVTWQFVRKSALTADLIEARQAAADAV